MAAAIVTFAAVPGVLVAFVGAPIPAHWTRHGVVSLHGLFDLLAVIAWAAWAACAWPMLRSVAARVRARDAAAGTGLALRVGDRLALRMAAAVLAMSSLGTASAAVTASAAGAAQAVAPIPPLAAPAPVAPRRGAGPGGIGSLGALPPHGTFGHQAPFRGPRAAVVGPRESLLSVAERAYGDGAAWPAIAKVNLGRPMPGGGRFMDPAVLRPGWMLLLPALEEPGTAGTAGTAVPVRLASELEAAAAGKATSESNPGPPAPARPATLLLPELAILGTGTLVAGLLARRARQARRLHAFVRAEGAPSPVPDELDATLACALAPFEAIPLLDWVDVALRALTMVADDRTLPPLQLIRAGAEGVDIRFAWSPTPPRPPWTAGSDASWLLAPSADLESLRSETRSHQPWTPVLLPLGDDEKDTWLLPLTPGACVALIGPAAQPLADAMVAGAQRWTWQDGLVVTPDPETAARAAATLGRRPDRSPLPGVLFTGDPQALSADVRRSCSVVTLAPTVDADITVLADRKAATVHPLGLTVRPHLLDPAWRDAIRAPASAPPVNREPAATPSHAPSQSLPPAWPTDWPPDGLPPATPAFRRRETDTTTMRVRLPEGPPAVQVRLLGPIPHVDGLPEPLPPKRARRCTEVLAYLAVHAPQPVTGDRLRTRVLGTADADAAAKTLFNTVAAARRALGSGADGTPLLPPANRSGHYSVSPLVTVDAMRCLELVEAGRAAADRTERLSLLHDALSLVEGEPLSGVLAGYAWWRAEGHERRVADAVVDGTCALIRAAVEARHLDLARWALAQGRVVEAYSEALTRAAMTVAAAAGDGARLHLEWQACCRQADDLDPGSTPSEATERVYARLRQRLRGGPDAGAADEGAGHAGDPTVALRG